MTLSWGRRLAASFVSALIVAIVAHLAVVFVMFVAQGLQPAMLVVGSDYFALSSVFAFVLVFVAALLGALRNRALALVAGLVAGLVAAFLGSIAIVVLAGAAFTADTWGQLFAAMVGVTLPFWLAVGVATATAGVPAARYVLGYRTAAGVRPVAFVRIPVPEFAAESPDAVQVDEQWDAYVTALSDAGFVTEEVRDTKDADGVYVGDAAVLLDSVAVLSSAGDASSVATVEASLRGRGYEIERLESGALSAADVLRAGDTVFVATGEATDAEGIRALRAAAARHGFTVVAVPPVVGRPLSEAFSVLPGGTVVGHAAAAVHVRLFGRYLDLPEPARVLALTVDTVLVPAAAAQSAELLAALGYRVVTVDLSTFESRGRGPRALSLLG